MSRELEPRGEVVEGVVVPAGGPAREVAGYTWQTQAQRDRTIENADEVLDQLRGALSNNTLAAYRQQWRRYLKWCQEHQRTPVPATRETLLSYLNSMKNAELAGGRRGMSVSTVRIALSALKRVHMWGNDAAPEWVGGDQAITDWVMSYAKARAKDPDTQPKRAAGARQVIMRALLDALPTDKVSGVRDRAVLLLGYYMAARRSELANLRMSNLRITVDGLEVYVAYSKTDQVGEGVWVAVPANEQHPEYDPLSAVQTWVDRCAAVGLVDGPLFRPINKYGQIVATNQAMSGQSFEVVMTRVVAAAYLRAKTANDRKLMALLDPAKVQLSPHSLRRGFATDARASAWDLLDISRHGRWSAQSKVVHIYIEEADKWLRHTNKPVRL
jgi:site-specific recombinase XerC